ncbi:hypothetical protein F2P56_013648 [Juglans regia]|uniref:Class V chitinase-like n=2 Tax=Juglans regia TaxID=51240 RepID=A0A2I4HG99_JUGRE|nr:class V chitinase-like [Juglans regia]KAF5469586.1 hypothetical protein F2P56_013648 [Juglans regia]
MAFSACTDSVVKSGYWFFGRDFNWPVSKIPSELFTHLYAGFAKVDDDGTVSTVLEQYSDQFRTFTDTVRVRCPQVKTLLSISGEGSPISPVVADTEKRQTFIRTSIELAWDLGFDGLDLGWLYPSNDDQKDQLSHFLNEWRSAVDKEVKKTLQNFTKTKPLLLTAAVFYHSVNNTFNYPIQAINEKLDWINVLAIDFYTPKSDSSPEETGPYKYKNGILNPKSFSGFFAPANTAKIDPVAYRDVQKEVELWRGIYETVYDSNYIAVYWHEINGEKWIDYDDALCIFGRVRGARTRNLGGYFAWHLATDDDN